MGQNGVTMKKCMEIFLNIIVRGIIGIGIIYLVNTVTNFYGINIAVGVNEVTVLTTSLLGIPGVIFLYAFALLC